MFYFTERNFYDMIQKHRQQQEENEDVSIKDICDGSQYKNLITNRSMEDNVLNLTFTMNTGKFLRFIMIYMYLL